MKKDTEWFSEQIMKKYPSQSEIDNPDYEIIAKIEIIQEALSLIDQLDEPELPVIPQFVADWIKECKARKHNLFGVYQFSPEVVSVWIFENESKKERVDLIAKAWLDGYTIEKEPDKLYEVKLPTENAMGNTMNLVQGGSKNRVWFDSLDDRIVKFKFTEQEIKAIDERYWSFAKEVTDNV